MIHDMRYAMSLFPSCFYPASCILYPASWIFLFCCGNLARHHGLAFLEARDDFEIIAVLPARLHFPLRKLAVRTGHVDKFLYTFALDRGRGDRKDAGLFLEGDRDVRGHVRLELPFGVADADERDVVHHVL